MNRNINESIMSDIKKIIKLYYGHLPTQMIADKVCNQIIPTLIELYFQKKPLQQSKSVASLNTVIQDFKQNLHGEKSSKLSKLCKQNIQIPIQILESIKKCLSLFILMQILCRKQVKRGFQKIKRQSQQKTHLLTNLLDIRTKILMKQAISKFLDNFHQKKEQQIALKCIQVIQKAMIKSSFENIKKYYLFNLKNQIMVKNGLKIIQILLNRKLRLSLKKIKQTNYLKNPWISRFVQKAALNSPANRQIVLWRIKKFSSNKIRIQRFQMLIRKAFLRKVFLVFQQQKKIDFQNHKIERKEKSFAQINALVNTMEAMFKLKQFEIKMESFEKLNSKTIEIFQQSQQQSMI